MAIVSAIELSNQGFDVTFFSAVGPICDELKKSKVKVICLDQSDILNDQNRVRAFTTGIWNNKAKKEMEKLLKEYDALNTVVHIHGFIKALTSSIMKPVLSKNFKIVITLHDYFMACPNGGFYNYKTQEICQTKPMSLRCITCDCDSRHYYHKIWRIIRQSNQIIRGHIPKYVKNYIYISEMNRDVLKSFLPQDARYYYVKNPVDLQKDKRVEVKKNNIFTFIGRFSKEKGALLFAEAAQKLNCEAVFIGDGQLKESIKEIYPNSKLTGWLDEKEINEYLFKSRALIFPSLWYEGLPLTVLEAKARGIPVIVSDKCSGKELISDKEFGLWFRRNDINDLCEKIDILIKDDALLSEMSKKAYNNYWDDSFDLKNHIDMLLKCYYDLK